MTDQPRNPNIKDTTPSKPQPPVSRYKLELTITGNTLDEIQDELQIMVNGGFHLDSGGGRRHEWECWGGTTTRRMRHTNPGMTPERYRAELREWFDARRAARKAQPND